MALGSGNIQIDVGARGLESDIVRQVRSAERKIRPISVSLDDRGFRQPLGRISGDMGEFQKSLDASVARTLAFGAAVGVLNAVTQGFKAMVASAVEVEKSLTDINVILNLNSGALNKFSEDLFNTAKNTGQSFQVVSEAAVELSRQGLGAEETINRINDAMILTRLSGMDAAKSVETLTAAVNGFGDAALTTTDLVNKLATVDAAFAVSTEDLSNALARAGSTAQSAKVSLDELLAAVTSVQQTTARGGSVIGNAFKSIFTRIQRSGVREALEDIGVATTDSAGNIRNALDILKDYAGVYKTLSDSQRAYTDELVAGVFQINNLKALVKDLGSDYSIYERALSQSNGATDEAVKRNEKLQSTLSALINEAAVNAKELASVLGDLVATPAVENLLKVFNSIAGALNSALDPEKGNSLIKNFFGAIGNFIAGPGLIIIGVAFIKLFKFITFQSAKALKEVFKIGSAKQKIAEAEAKIGFLLKNNKTLYEAISREALSHEQKEELVLDTIRQQNAAYAAQQAMVSRLAKSRRVGAAVNNTSGGARNKADGYVPNFANGVSGAMSAERQAILAGEGGASSSARPKVLPNFPMGGGRKETIVANTDEYIVPRFGGGSGSAIFNKEMVKKAGGVPQGAIPVSGGFIPNFAKGKSGLATKGSNIEKSSIWKNATTNYPSLSVDVDKQLGGFGMISLKGNSGPFNKAGKLNPFGSNYLGPEQGKKIIQSIAGSRLNAQEQGLVLRKISKLGGGALGVSFENIGGSTFSKLNEANANDFSGQKGVFNDIIGDSIANATATISAKIYGRLFGDEVKANDLVSSVWKEADKTKIVDTGAEGSIFEAAIRLGSKASAKTFGTNSSQATWDFEESSRISEDLKDMFFTSSGYPNILKADAKRVGSSSEETKVIKKAYGTSFFKERLEGIHTEQYAPLVQKAILAKNDVKSKAGGYIPSFIESIPDKAVNQFTGPNYKPQDIKKFGKLKPENQNLFKKSVKESELASFINKKLRDDNWRDFISNNFVHRRSDWSKNNYKNINENSLANRAENFKVQGDKSAYIYTRGSKPSQWQKQINSLMSSEEGKSKIPKKLVENFGRSWYGFDSVSMGSPEMSKSNIDYQELRGRIDKSVKKGINGKSKISMSSLLGIGEEIFPNTNASIDEDWRAHFQGILKSNKKYYSARIKEYNKKYPNPTSDRQNKGRVTGRIFEELITSAQKAVNKESGYLSQLDNNNWDFYSLTEKEKEVLNISSSNFGDYKTTLDSSTNQTSFLKKFIREPYGNAAEGLVPNFSLFASPLPGDSGRSNQLDHFKKNSYGAYDQTLNLRSFFPKSGSIAIGNLFRDVFAMAEAGTPYKKIEAGEIVGPRIPKMMVTAKRILDKQRSGGLKQPPMDILGFMEPFELFTTLSRNKKWYESEKESAKKSGKKFTPSAPGRGIKKQSLASKYVPKEGKDFVKSLRDLGLPVNTKDPRGGFREFDKFYLKNLPLFQGGFAEGFIPSFEDGSKLGGFGEYSDIYDKETYDGRSLDIGYLSSEATSGPKVFRNLLKQITGAALQGKPYTEIQAGSVIGPRIPSVLVKAKRILDRQRASGKNIPFMKVDGLLSPPARLFEKLAGKKRDQKRQGLRGASRAEYKTGEEKELLKSLKILGLNPKSQQLIDLQSVPMLQNFSQGFIPNFADALEEAIVREREALSSQRSNAKIYVDKDNRLKGSKNPMGLLVANTRDEPLSGSQGVDRALSTGINPKNKGSIESTANGYVPNFAVGGVVAGGRGLLTLLGKIGPLFKSMKGSVGGFLGKGSSFSKIMGGLTSGFKKIFGLLIAAELAFVPILKTMGIIPEEFTSITDLIGEGLGRLFGTIDPAIQKLIKVGDKYVEASEKQLNVITQNIEKVDKFAATLASLSKSTDSGNIEAYGKFLEQLISQAGNMEGIDATAFQNLLDSAGDAEGLKKATQELKDLIEQGKNLKGFGVTVAETFKKLAENIDSETGKVDFDKAGVTESDIKGTSSQLIKNLSPEKVKQLAEELKGFDATSENSADKIASLQHIFGELDATTLVLLKGNGEYAKKLLESAAAQARYNTAAAALAEAINKTRLPIKNLEKDFNKLATAIESSSAAIDASYKSLSEIEEIKSKSRVDTLKSAGTVTSTNIIKGTADAKIEKAVQNAAKESEKALGKFSSTILRDSKENSQALDGGIKTLIEGIADGSQTNDSAIQALIEIEKTGTEEQKKAAAEARSELQSANTKLLTEQAKTRAVMNAQLAEERNQAVAFQRNNQLSEGQLKSLQTFSKGQQSSLGQISELNKVISTIQSLGGNKDILAELQESNRQQSQLSNLNQAFSSLASGAGVEFNASSLDELDGQVTDFIRSDSFNQLDEKTRALVVALTSAIDKAKSLEVDAGVKTQGDVSKAATTVISQESIKSFSDELKLILSGPLVEALKVNPIIVSKLNEPLGELGVIAQEISNQSTVNLQNQEANKKIKEETSRLLTSVVSEIKGSGLKDSSSNLENSARLLEKAAEKITGNNASGFIPNFAPVSPVSRALNTERSMGAKKPVIDSHPSVGAYVRDAATQPNFSAVKRDHPEGMNKAIKNSAKIQGAAARGLVPNFAGSEGDLSSASLAEIYSQAMGKSDKLQRIEEYIAEGGKTTMQASKVPGWNLIKKEIYRQTGLGKEDPLKSGVTLSLDTPPDYEVLNGEGNLGAFDPATEKLWMSEFPTKGMPNKALSEIQSTLANESIHWIQNKYKKQLGGFGSKEYQQWLANTMQKQDKALGGVGFGETRYAKSFDDIGINKKAGAYQDFLEGKKFSQEEVLKRFDVKDLKNIPSLDDMMKMGTPAEAWLANDLRFYVPKVMDKQEELWKSVGLTHRRAMDIGELSGLMKGGIGRLRDAYFLEKAPTTWPKFRKTGDPLDLEVGTDLLGAKLDMYLNNPEFRKYWFDEKGNSKFLKDPQGTLKALGEEVDVKPLLNFMKHSQSVFQTDETGKPAFEGTRQTFVNQYNTSVAKLLTERMSHMASIGVRNLQREKGGNEFAPLAGGFIPNFASTGLTDKEKRVQEYVEKGGEKTMKSSKFPGWSSIKGEIYRQTGLAKEDPLGSGYTAHLDFRPYKVLDGPSNLGAFDPKTEKVWLSEFPTKKTPQKDVSEMQSVLANESMHWIQNKYQNELGGIKSKEYQQWLMGTMQKQDKGLGGVGFGEARYAESFGDIGIGGKAGAYKEFLEAKKFSQEEVLKRFDVKDLKNIPTLDDMMKMGSPAEAWLANDLKNYAPHIMNDQEAIWRKAGLTHKTPGGSGDFGAINEVGEADLTGVKRLRKGYWLDQAEKTWPKFRQTGDPLDLELSGKHLGLELDMVLNDPDLRDYWFDEKGNSKFNKDPQGTLNAIGKDFDIDPFIVFIQGIMSGFKKNKEGLNEFEQIRGRFTEQYNVSLSKLLQERMSHMASIGVRNLQKEKGGNKFTPLAGGFIPNFAKTEDESFTDSISLADKEGIVKNAYFGGRIDKNLWLDRVDVPPFVDQQRLGDLYKKSEVFDRAAKIREHSIDPLNYKDYTSRINKLSSHVPKILQNKFSNLLFSDKSGFAEWSKENYEGLAENVTGPLETAGDVLGVTSLASAALIPTPLAPIATPTAALTGTLSTMAYAGAGIGGILSDTFEDPEKLRGAYNALFNNGYFASKTSFGEPAKSLIKNGAPELLGETLKKSYGNIAYPLFHKMGGSTQPGLLQQAAGRGELDMDLFSIGSSTLRSSKLKISDSQKQIAQHAMITAKFGTGSGFEAALSASTGLSGVGDYFNGINVYKKVIDDLSTNESYNIPFDFKDGEFTASGKTGWKVGEKSTSWNLGELEAIEKKIEDSIFWKNESIKALQSVKGKSANEKGQIVYSKEKADEDEIKIQQHKRERQQHVAAGSLARKYMKQFKLSKESRKNMIVNQRGNINTGQLDGRLLTFPNPFVQGADLFSVATPDMRDSTGQGGKMYLAYNNLLDHRVHAGNRNEPTADATKFIDNTFENGAITNSKSALNSFLSTDFDSFISKMSLVKPQSVSSGLTQAFVALMNTDVEGSKEAIEKNRRQKSRAQVIKDKGLAGVNANPKDKDDIQGPKLPGADAFDPVVQGEKDALAELGMDPQVILDRLKEEETANQTRETNIRDQLYLKLLNKETEKIRGSDASVNALSRMMRISDKMPFMQDQLDKMIFQRQRRAKSIRDNPNTTVQANLSQIESEIGALQSRRSLYEPGNEEGMAYLYFTQGGQFSKVGGDQRRLGPPMYESVPDYAKKFQELREALRLNGPTDAENRMKEIKEGGEELKGVMLSDGPNVMNFARMRNQKGNKGVKTGGQFEKFFTDLDIDSRMSLMRSLGARDEHDLHNHIPDDLRTVLEENLMRVGQGNPAFGFLVDETINKGFGLGEDHFINAVKNLGVPFHSSQGVGDQLSKEQVKISGKQTLEGMKSFDVNALEGSDIEGALSFMNKIQIQDWLHKNKEEAENIQGNPFQHLTEILAGTSHAELMKSPVYLKYLMGLGQGFNPDTNLKSALLNKGNVGNFDKWKSFYHSGVPRTDFFKNENYGPIEWSKNVEDKPKLNRDGLNPFVELLGDAELNTEKKMLSHLFGPDLTYGANQSIDDLVNNTTNPIPKLKSKDWQNRAEQASKHINDRVKNISNANTGNEILSSYAPFGYDSLGTYKRNSPYYSGSPSMQTLWDLIMENKVDFADANAAGKAKGFVPNFSAIAGEIAASKMAGYKNPVKPSQVKTMNISGIGKTSYNTQESVFKAAGMSQPFIAPPSNSKAAPQYQKQVQKKFNFDPYKKAAADGFIPKGGSSLDFSEFKSIADKFSETTSVFASAISDLRFDEFSKSTKILFDGASMFSAQSQALQNSAGLFHDGSEKIARSADIETINFEKLTSAASKIEKSFNTLSSELKKSLSIDSSGITRSMDSLTSALGSVQGSISVSIPSVQVDVNGAGQITQSIKSVIMSELPGVIKSEIESMDLVTKSMMGL